jgi:formylmethanofuran dehydrogenase subunit A
MRQFAARKLARPHKWVSWDAECEGGGGIVPYQYKAKNFVNTLQWAIGLEIFLLVDDPWRIFFTTDHPNGAPFTRYPQLFRLLMDKDYRSAWLEQVNGKALELALLPQLEREYSLYEIAIMTRAAPARLLGLSDRGQLGAGAIADIAVYSEQSNVEAMFAAADLVFKSGELVVRDGQVVASPKGAIHTIRPAFDHAVERSLQGYFDQFYTLKLDNFKVHDSVFQQQGSALVAHSC